MVAVASAFPFAASSIPSSQSASALRDGAAIHRSASIQSGYPSLNRQLPNGGWPASMLIELLLANPDEGELRLLAPVLKRIVQAGKKLILLAPSHISFSATLRELGIDMTNVILIEADQPIDRIASVELAMKSPDFGALLCWLPEARDDHLRRLQLAAADSAGLTFLFRPLPAQNQSSPAPLRIICQPLPAGRMSIEIIKRRGPVYVDPIILPLSIPEIMVRSLAVRNLTRPVFNARPYAMDRAAMGVPVARQRAALSA